MPALLRNALALCAMLMAGHALAQITFYENENFQGQSFTTERQIGNFERFGFNDRASSVVVTRERWEVCDDIRFNGRCVVLRPGRYPSLFAMGLSERVSSVRAIDRNARIDDDRYPPALVAPAQIIFYERENFEGQSFTAENQIDDFDRSGFNDRASSVVVLGGSWEACDDARFGGRCIVLRPGRYPSLASMGMNDRLSSVRALRSGARINDDRYAPPPPAQVYDNRKRRDERLYEANVTSVRAVVGTPEQRCWVEREAVAPPRDNRGSPNVGGAIAGALIGGILGHQVGGGTGKDLATIGGAVGGAALGANVGRNSAGQAVASQDVQRCASQPSQARPEYWDVTYTFRGQEHRVQMTAPPGATITVNEQGEPRA